MDKNHDAFLIFFLIVLICGISCKVYSEEPDIDSLKIELTKSKAASKLEILHQLTHELRYNDPDEAMKYSRMAYELALSDHDSVNMALSLKNMGIENYYMGESDSALNNYHEALSIYLSLKNERGISGCLNNIGIIYMETGLYDKALGYYKKSARIDYSLGDEEGLASTLSNIGEIYHLQGNYDKALSFYEKSLYLEVKHKNYNGIGESLMNIGAIYEENGLFSESMQAYEKALDIFGVLGNKSRTAQVYHNLGQLYYSLNDIYHAYTCACPAMKLWKELDNRQGLASTTNLLAIIYEAAGDEDKANEYLFRAIMLDLELGNQKKVSIVLTNKGKMLFKEKEYSEAVNFFLNSLEISRDIGAWPEILDNYEYLSASYFQLKDSIQGRFYDDLFRILADSIKNESKKITSAEQRKSQSFISAGFINKSNDSTYSFLHNHFSYIIFSISFIVITIVFIFLLIQKRN